MSTTYQKIPAPYLRESTKPHRIVQGAWTTPELGLLAEAEWEFTEKIDGTNVRVMWDGHRVMIGGRTDDAQFSTKLLTKLTELFADEGCEELFEQTFGSGPAVLYGEGFGPGINKAGKLYSDEMDFALFDVRVGDWWLEPPNVLDVAEKLGLRTSPVVFRGTLKEAISLITADLLFSEVAATPKTPMEGMVGRPAVQLFNRQGERIIVNVKTKDFRR